MSGRGRWLWLPLAAFSGVLWARCFEREALILAPCLALVPLMLLLSRARPAAVGLIFGLAYWLAAMPWIRPTLTAYGGLPGWLATLGLVAAAAYLALYSAVFASLAARLGRRGPFLALVGPPAVWVALETVRGRGPLAFPWNLAGYAAIEVPGALPLAGAIGAWGLSFLVVGINTALARAVERRDWRPAALALGAAGGLLALALGAGGRAESAAAESAPRVALLQPNTPVTAVVDEPLARRNYARLLAQADAACAAGPALLVWPESATWPFSYQRHRRLRQDVAALAGRGCPVLLNSAMRDGEAVFNSVLLVAAPDATQRYDKQRLVPFGETVPFSTWLPGLRAIARTAGGFSAGSDDPLLRWHEERLGPAICFEIVFPAAAARQTRRGATALVTVTNDGWYGDSSAPWQHFRAARFRAAENRRPVLRAAITGVSAVIGADGSVESRLAVGERGVLVATLGRGGGLSFFSRYPWLVPILCWAVVPFAILRLDGGREKA